MRRLFSKPDLRTLGLTMALVILSTGLSLSTGVTIVLQDRQPELTANICQPLQSSDVAIDLLLVHPVIAVPKFLLRDLGSATPMEPAPTTDRGEAPDTPPPKLV